jgi:D-beta-D-heptose 7-phosphate kinase/D-beta-D-heptose 1-phosphate adenosyltransferase
MKIAVIGDSITDHYIYGTVERISPESPIPIFKESNQESWSQGGAANVAANLKSFGSDIKFYHDTLKNSIKHRYVCDNHIMFRSDNESYNINEKIDFDLTDVSYCILSDYNKGFLHHSQQIIDYCHSKGCEVIVDPKKHLSNYRNADYVKLNKKEILSYADGESYDTIRKKYNIGTLIITLGSNGVYISSEDYEGAIPCDQHQVSDVTGAGDVFIACLAHYLNNGNDLYTSCFKANKLAAFSVTKFGTYKLTNEDLRQVITVFTNGCFDILHKGHVDYLKKSKEMGARLIVGLNSDASVKRLKGIDRPINSQEDRKAVLESLGCVDEVIIFDEDTPYELIKKVKPDIITKGGDYQPNTVVGNDLAQVVIVPLVEGISTTKIIERF